MSNRIAVLLWICAAVAQAAAPQYTIETFAGTDFNGDGRSATGAVLIQPQSVVTDRSGAVYFSDAGDHRVRKVSGGIIQTFAGTGVAGYRGDRGPATQAQLNAPYGLAMDLFGNVFVADLGNACVRRIAPDGTILTVAGGGDTVPDGKTSIAGTRARLTQPRDLAVDRVGNVFIADFGAHRVYELTPGGVLSVVAGTGQQGAAREPVRAVEAALSHPAGLAVDEFRSLYIADSGNRRVRKVAGGVLTTLSDKAGKPFEFGTPTGLALDAGGRLYVADGGARMTVITPAGDLLSWPIGGTSVAVGPLMEIYATSERQVKRLVAGVVESVAGIAAGAGAGDGRPKAEWRFQTPSAVVRDGSGAVYIADTGNGRVRRIGPSGDLITLTTQIEAPVALALDSLVRLHVADRATGNIYRVLTNGRVEVFAKGSDNRPFKPGGMAFDSRDQLYIADTGNNLIRRVNTDGTLTLIAGGGTADSDGPALLARLGSPVGVAVDAAGTVWFTEASTARLRKVTADGNVETIPGLELKEPRSLRALKDGQFLIADAGSHRVLRVSPDGAWTPVAGSGDRGFGGDGSHALAAMLNSPSDIAIEPDGAILLADTGNNRIRRLVPISTTPGTPEGPPPPALTAAPLTLQHAATRRAQPLAPGQLAIVIGDPLPLGDLKITFSGVPAAVLARGGNSATVLVPPGTATGSVDVMATGADGEENVGLAEILPVAPGVLATQDGAGQAAALNEDGWPNSVENPASRGSVLSLYLTGQGAGDPVIEAEIAGYSCEVVWSGGAPGFAGLWQVNVRTPSGFAPAGVLPLVLTVNGVRTQSGVTVVTR